MGVDSEGAVDEDDESVVVEDEGGLKDESVVED